MHIWNPAFCKSCDVPKFYFKPLFPRHPLQFVKKLNTIYKVDGWKWNGSKAYDNSFLGFLAHSRRSACLCVTQMKRKTRSRHFRSVTATKHANFLSTMLNLNRFLVTFVHTGRFISTFSLCLTIDVHEKRLVMIFTL